MILATTAETDESHTSHSGQNVHESVTEKIDSGVVGSPQESAVAQTPEGHPDLARQLQHLGVSFTDRYKTSGNLEDLEAALQNNRAAVAQTPKDHPDLAQRLQNLAVSLRNRYRRSGNLDDLEAALENKKAALAQTPKGHPDLAGRLQSLAVSFADRYRRLGNLEDLEAALENDKAAVAQTPNSHPHLAGRLQYLAVSFGDRYKRSGNLEDLEAALGNKKAAVAQTPKDHPELAGRLQSLAVSLIDRYRRLGNLEDLEAALENDKAAVAQTPKGHPDLAGRLHHLAVSLIDRSQRLGNLEDLEAALENDKAAVAQTPKGHPDLAGRLHHLAVSFTDRYRRSGNLEDLEAALDNKRAAVAQTPKGHPDLAGRLQHLAVSLIDRYQRLGNLEDLEAALENDKAAVAQTPKGHPDLAGRLHHLAVSFTDRYRRSGKVEDLEAALENDKAAMAQTPKGHPDLAVRLQHLAVSFTDRYQRSGNLEDLEAALKNNEAAVAQTPKGHPDLAVRLRNLAVSFTDRYRRSGNLEDLEAALENKKAAVAQTPKGHPDLAGRLQSLAQSFVDQYELSGDPQDVGIALSHYSMSFTATSSDLAGAWTAALKWASLAALHNPMQVVPAYSAAFRLLPDLLWIGNPISVRQDRNRIMNISQATSDAVSACIHLSNLKSGTEFLEQGLGTSFQQLIQLKTTADAIPASDAAQLELLSMELYSGVSEDPQRTSVKRSTLITKIRQLPGLENFLLPRQYKDLCKASLHGPIVILNSHQDNCDAIALIRPTSDPLHIPLPDASVNELRTIKTNLRDTIKGRNFRSTKDQISRLVGRREGEPNMKELLNLMWTCIVNPIYIALEANGVTSGRLWWCPIGDFTALPLHAADPSDRFIQSYTSTLGALLEGTPKKDLDHAPRVGIVGVTHTGPGGVQALPAVQSEVAKITSIISDKYEVQSLMGERATVDPVTQQLKDCAWIHLACHASQNLTDPPKSSFQLYGGTLDLETILKTPLPHAEFVFLAGCETARGDGSAFIAAGFQGAIATMWSMCDEDGPVVAEAVYSHLFAGDKRPQASNAAQALQLAVQNLRKAGVPYERWVPFIHLGI
ncbi:CHAT domain-containing protein [Mycena vulgaris]|nr:CHAT domain-containing protein [Mycena vulgaris]